MKKILTTICLFLSLSVNAGFVEGFVAYDAGDYAVALKEFKSAAIKGDAKSQYLLGVMYSLGQGVSQDYAQAANWHRKAAEQGYAGAQSKLAALYVVGYGVPQDCAQAIFWYQKAAEQRDSQAQAILAKITDKNSNDNSLRLLSAFYWIRDSAEHGNNISQSVMGQLYIDGSGVPQDYVQAYAWINIVASNPAPIDDGLAKKAIDTRSMLVNKMSAIQKDKAQKLSQEYFIKYAQKN